jgi:transcriptional regulator with XRE-family HTH domain
MNAISTPDELAIQLGENIKTLRLQKNLNRQTLCAEAGISENALRHLEGGKGATVTTLIRVVKSLGCESWIAAIAPQVSINPLHMIRAKQPRQRARRRSHEKKE